MLLDENTSSNHHITFEEYEYDDGELGLEESEIEEIDTLIYEEAKGSSSAGEKPGAIGRSQCPICYEDYEQGQTLRNLRC